MKLKFKNQGFQENATAAVCDVFLGQPYHDPNTYTVDPGKKITATPKLEQVDFFGQTISQSTFDYEDVPEVGYKNAEIVLTSESLQANLHKVQDRLNINYSVLNPSLPELEVEMETGTGKTFVYIKTAFELNKRYGWSKFIIIVPGIAIREGVKKSLDIMAEKFQADYGKIAKTYVYNSAHPQDVLDFSTSNGIQILVMNVQAFNAQGVNAKGKDARRIFMELDEFGTRKPIDLIAANRPILILDEPQKMEGKKTNEMLPLFNPLMILRYSATHKTLRNLVYRLDAIDAFEQKLVKKIEPVCIDINNRSATEAYVYCAEIRPSAEGPEALIEFQVNQKGQGVNKTRIVRKGDDLYSLSKVEAYKDRFRIIELNAKDGYGTLGFENGITLVPGQVIGDVTEEALRRIQIREAIKAHLEKELQLFKQGIKVLTLFFVDKVANYRVYDKDAESKGVYANMFEKAYREIVAEKLYENGTVIDSELKAYWEGISAEKTHAGYFAEDKKHRLVDSKEGKESESDTSAYDLILKNKEHLLSLDEPVRFIFSHSALREGWDNPNVFVICPLKKPDAGNNVARRQEVGRGLRLCVNQEGERQDDPASVHTVNVLTIIANEEFLTYVGGLQKEIMEACARRPVKADVNFFVGKILDISPDVRNPNVEKKHKITIQEANIINYALKNAGYLDVATDEILPKWREDRNSELGTKIELPGQFFVYKESLTALIDSIQDKNALKRFTEPKRPRPIVPNKNFAKEEFKELWNRINHKTVYTVDFKSEELIKKSIEALNNRESGLIIPKLTYTVRSASQMKGNQFSAAKTETRQVDKAFTETETKYDLIGKVAEGTTLTRKTIKAILSKIEKPVFDQFSDNPEKFIAECIRIINEQKATRIIESIEYHVLEDTYGVDIFTKNQMIVENQKTPIRDDGKVLQKHIYDFLMSDSKGEREFAKELDLSEEVVVYAKLPTGFSIPTPVGSYNPDWAIAFEKGKVKHLFFVAETKGSMSEMQLRPIEQIKIRCAEKHFKALSNKNLKYHVAYKKVASYQDLCNHLNSSDV